MCGIIHKMKNLFFVLLIRQISICGAALPIRTCQGQNRFFGPAFSRKKGWRVKGSALAAVRRRRNTLTLCALGKG